MKRVFSTRALIVFFVGLLVFQLIWDAYLYTLPSHTTNANYWFNVVYASTSTLIAVVGLLSVYLGRERHQPSSVAVLLLSLSALLNGFGLYFWAYYNLFSHVAVPYPSLADYFFLAFPILMISGFWILLNQYKPSITLSLVAEALFVGPICSMLIFYFFFIPSVDQTMGLLAKFVTIATPWEDAFLIGTLYVAFRIRSGFFHRYFRLFGLSMLIFVAADFTFQYRTIANTYWNGDIADLLYLLNMFVFAIALIFAIDTHTKNAEKMAPTAKLSPSVAGQNIGKN